MHVHPGLFTREEIKPVTAIPENGRTHADKVFLIFISVVVATAAAVFEKTLQSAVEMKSENDLTV